MKLLQLVTIFGASLLMAAPSAALAAVSFDPSNLVADADFVRSDTMDEASIQNTLMAMGSGLATISPDRLGSSDRAAKIIYDAARAADINPIVLLVTLQKEQSLLTTGNPSQYALDRAVGYNVPDGLGTQDLYSFEAQLKGKNGYMGAARWYRDKFDRKIGPGSYSCCGGSFSVQEKSWVSGVNVDISPKSVATALLYRYTPYVYNGNYNFWNLWQIYFSEYSWFANSISPDSSIRTIYATVVNNRAYLVSYAGNGGLVQRALVAGTTDQPVNVCVVGDNIKMAWVDAGNREIYISTYSKNGLTFVSTEDTGEQSDRGVAIGCTADKTYIAWKGSNNQYMNVRVVGGAKNTLLSELTPETPALTTFGSDLVIGWKGFGNDYLNVARSSDVFATQAKKTLDTELSEKYFNLTATSDKLYIMWKGYGNRYINIAESTDAQTFTNKYTPGDETNLTPNGAVIGGEPVMVYAGLDQALNRKNMTTNNLKTIYSEKLAITPAIATDVAP